MPIEFKCNRCSRTLRVPDGSYGRSCSCPGCMNQLVVPVISGEEKGGRIEVPCPKCKNILQCDAKLDGTRGCCPSCAHVFTISLSNVSVDIAPQETFPFACPKCKQLFEGTPDKEGKKGKCTGCGEVFVIECYVPPKPAIVATPKPVAAKPIATKLAKPTYAAPKEQPVYNNPMTDLSSLLPRAAPYYSEATFVPPQAQASKSKSKKRSSTAGQGSKVGLILWIASGIGVLSLVCCGGFGVFMLSINSRRAIPFESPNSAAESKMQVKEKTVDSVLLKPNVVLNGHLQLLVPDGFALMGESMLVTKYPSGNRPTIVFTNQSGSINVIVNHTPNRVSPKQLRQLHQQLDSSIRQTIPPSAWRFSGFQHHNGREWIQLEFTSSAIDTNISNIMVATSLDNRMLAVSFNVTQELEREWQNAGREIINSLVAIE